MKRANSVTVTLSATLLFCAVSAVASQPEIIDLPETLCCCPEPPAAPECTMLDNFSEKLARIEARIGELTLELNRLVWETAECGSMSSMPLQAPIRGSRANKMILCNDFMIVGFRK